jgi:hypothetical protein
MPPFRFAIIFAFIIERFLRHRFDTLTPRATPYCLTLPLSITLIFLFDYFRLPT